jgi:hypothetical protein
MLTEHPVLRAVRHIATVLSLMLIALLLLTVLTG